MSYNRRNPYMSINHGLIGGKRESQKGYVAILSHSEYASIYSKLFTFDNFDEMSNNPLLNWEYRLKQLWNIMHLTEFIDNEVNLVVVKSKKYKSLFRFEGEDDIGDFQGLKDAWNDLLDFDIENWFNIPYNSDENYKIKQMPAWPRGTFAWRADLKTTKQILHKGWSGHDFDYYCGFNYIITVNSITLVATDTNDESFGCQDIIRKIGDTPYELSIPNI